MGDVGLKSVQCWLDRSVGILPASHVGETPNTVYLAFFWIKANAVRFFAIALWLALRTGNEGLGFFRIVRSLLISRLLTVFASPTRLIAFACTALRTLLEVSSVGHPWADLMISILRS